MVINVKFLSYIIDVYMTSKHNIKEKAKQHFSKYLKKGKKFAILTFKFLFRSSFSRLKTLIGHAVKGYISLLCKNRNLALNLIKGASRNTTTPTENRILFLQDGVHGSQHD